MNNPPAKAARRKSASTPSTRVLIVDDHELLREGLKELLRGESHVELCGEATGEAEAMEQVRSTHPDLVIVDLSLRQGSGLDLIDRIRTFDDSIQIIVCTMYDEALYSERAVRAGASGYVNKQAPAATILTAVAEVLAGRLFLNPAVAERLLRRVTGRRDATKSPMESLSDRELQVFGLIGEGLTTSQIAQELHLSTRTVQTYRGRLKAKLNLKHSSELNRDAARFGLPDRHHDN